MATNYEKYFGTPEKVLETMSELGICVFHAVYKDGICPCTHSVNDCVDPCYDEAILWLQEECDG